MTQEQALREAKDNACIKLKSYNSFDELLNACRQNHTSIENLIYHMEMAILEYSSSQLKAKDREIEELKDFNSNALNEIGKLGAQLQQATASSGEREGSVEMWDDIRAMVERNADSDIIMNVLQRDYFVQPKIQSTPSEHTEVKEGEGRDGGFGKWTGNEGNGYDPKSV